MSKKLKLFEDEEFTFKHKFFTLMDLLVSNQSTTGFHSFLLMGIFYLQIISLFFSERLEILNPHGTKSDYILNIIEKIIRVKDLFHQNKSTFHILVIIIFVILLLITIHFLINCAFLKKNCYYSTQKYFMNFYIKIFLYVGYNIILDISFTSFQLKINTVYLIFSIISVFFTVFSYIFISIYYNDSFFLFY